MNEAREKQTFDVFLSHNSKDKPAVRALAALLTKRGIKVWFDEDQLIPGQPWQPLLEKGITESATGAVLVGGDGLGPWEDEEMQALLNLAVREKKPVISVLLPGAPHKPDLPLFLSNRTWVDLREGFVEDELAKLIWGITGKKPDSASVFQPAPGLKIGVTRLRHGAEQLVGREKELGRLDAAWHDPKTHVVTIVAWGGVGKTALVVDWMARMAGDGWRGAERVFDWSFYSQGTREQGETSADLFVAKALEFFGDPEMAQSPASPWDKGERLARLVGDRRTLLVLDGLEPLQYPPGPLAGQLHDPTIATLLRGLARHNPGLCLVTTRESVADIAPFRNATAPEWPLEHLSEEAGAQLLFDTGVKKAGNAKIKADDHELKEAAREVDGHALTLRLSGNYLRLAHSGDIRKRDVIAFDDADAQFKTNPADADKSYGHAFKVMAAYERWLGGGDQEGKRQLAVLHLIGLFDRPADVGCLTALRQAPVIDGLTELLVGLSEAQWNVTISRLQECGIISRQADDPSCVNSHLSLDAHPLVREYFAKRLCERSPSAWREAHRRLYEHLTESTEHQPNTLAGLQHLYQAVAHGCQAGMQQESCDKVYIDRILRGIGVDGFFSTSKLGLFGLDHCAIRHLLGLHRKETPLTSGLDIVSRIFLLHQAAFDLRSLGQPEGAIARFREALSNAKDRNEWKHAARTSTNLSETLLLLGCIDQSADEARISLEYATLSHDNFRLMDARHALGIALLYGADRTAHTQRLKEAQDLLGAAERQRRSEEKHDPQFLMREFQFCELLLGCAERAAWRLMLGLGPLPSEQTSRRLKQAGKVAKQARALAEPTIQSGARRGLNELSLGRTQFYEAVLNGGKPDASENKINDAVNLLRGAGRQDHAPRALLSHAWLRFAKGDADGSRADLDEAWQIAERGSMRLHMADIHLYRARLFRGVKPYPWKCPKHDLVEARKLIDECGYHRRDGELTDAEEAAKGW